MIKLVAFDLDGTIADTIPMCIEAFKQAVTPYASKILSEDDIVKTFGLNEEGMIKQVVAEDWEKALIDFYTIYKEMHTMYIQPFTEIRELITELKENSLIVSLVTGKGQKSCDITLRHFEMEALFDSISIGSPDRNTKAESMVKLMSKYNIQPAEMVYVGDEFSDITACSKVGIQCLSAAWIASLSKMKKLEKENQGYVFSSIKSLHSFLKKEAHLV